MVSMHSEELSQSVPSGKISETSIGIAGCAGFIGAHVTRRLLEAGYGVVGVDDFREDLYPATYRRKVIDSQRGHPQFTFIEADLVEGVPNPLVDVDFVVNLAGLPGQGRSWEIPDRYQAVNAAAAGKLYEAALAHGVRRFVQASTSSVYGEIADGDESQSIAPCSPYGSSKADGDALLLALEKSDCPLVILRLYSVYGPGQRDDMGFFRIIKAGLHGEIAPIHNRPGLARDFTYVGDVAAAFEVALGPKIPAGIYHISSSMPFTLSDVLATISAALDVPLRTRFVPTPRGLQTRTSGDTTKFRTVTSWRPTTSLKEGIALQVAWQKTL